MDQTLHDRKGNLKKKIKYLNTFYMMHDNKPSADKYDECYWVCSLL